MATWGLGGCGCWQRGLRGRGTRSDPTWVLDVYGDCISLLGLPYLGGLNNRNLFSHSSGGWKSEIKVSAGLVPSAASLLGV